MVISYPALSLDMLVPYGHCSGEELRDNALKGPRVTYGHSLATGGGSGDIWPLTGRTGRFIFGGRLWILIVMRLARFVA